MEQRRRDYGATRREFLRLGASAGLMAGLGPQALLGAIDSGVVAGTVYGDGAPLAGVRVSDGLSVVATDAKGRFSLSVGPQSGHFLSFCDDPAGLLDRGTAGHRWLNPGFFPGHAHLE